MNIKLKTRHEVRKMKKSARILREVLEGLQDIVQPGVSTYKLDQFAYIHITKNNAKPAFLGYRPSPDVPPFPGTLCISINEEVVHGIPSKDRILRNGDIVSIDCGVLKNGFYSDAAYTYKVGNIDQQKKMLCDTTRQALLNGIEAFKVGNTLGDVGWSVENTALEAGYSVVKVFVGHGIGRELHEPPQVPNYGLKNHGLAFEKGLALAIEPMVNFGTEDVEILDDRWTVVTADRKASAHFEHTTVLTDEGTEILTMFDGF